MTSARQAVILAGGKGTRLRARLGDLPKPLVDIGGTPLLERQIALVKRHGFTEVLVLVNHGARQIVEFCADRGNWGLRVDCLDDGAPRGTAGATLAALPRLAEEFLVIYGDTMLEIDLARFYAFHRATPGAAATLLLHPNDHPHDSDLVEVDDALRITAFHPRPHDPRRYYQNLVNAALYYVRRTSLEPWRSRPGPLDFGSDVFPEMLSRGQVLAGYNCPEYIKDCGTPERLDAVRADVAAGRVARASLNTAQRAVFLDRDGTINREVGHLASHEQLELLPGAAQAIREINRSGYRAVVISNQPVLARGDCSWSELKRIHSKMETLLGRQGAYLDRIYFCPHHPHRGYAGEVAELKVSCDCRKPEIGMVKLAAKELNIELSQSWMVGDTPIDVLTARNAGMRAILVETGAPRSGEGTSLAADHVAPDLPAAARYILSAEPRA